MAPIVNPMFTNLLYKAALLYLLMTNASIDMLSLVVSRTCNTLVSLFFLKFSLEIIPFVPVPQNLLNRLAFLLQYPLTENLFVQSIMSQRLW